MSFIDSRLKNLPRSAQIIVFAVVIVSLVGVFYLYYMKDLIEKRRLLQADVTKLEASVAQGTAIESRLKRFKQELASLEERLAVLRSILPAQKETPTVLRGVQQMAASSDLKILKFTPQPVVPRAFYSDWPIVIQVRGSYHGLGSFFEKIGKATRIIDVGAISIKGMENITDRTQTLESTCTATTFVFSEDQIAPTPQEDPIRSQHANNFP